MITAYIDAAMKSARCRILDDGTFFGEIPALQGVWGNSETLEGCRQELQEVLEDWLILKLRDNDDDIPMLSAGESTPSCRKGC
jgi:predicted RNase H-like HicB family nuclease